MAPSSAFSGRKRPAIPPRRRPLIPTGQSHPVARAAKNPVAPIWVAYQAIVISNEEGAQIERLNYLLSNGCKEGLVDHLRDWPGVHCVRHLLDGEPLVGAWFDRTQEY